MYKVTVHSFENDGDYEWSRSKLVETKEEAETLVRLVSSLFESDHDDPYSIGNDTNSHSFEDCVINALFCASKLLTINNLPNFGIFKDNLMVIFKDYIKDEGFDVDNFTDDDWGEFFFELDDYDEVKKGCEDEINQWCKYINQINDELLGHSKYYSFRSCNHAEYEEVNG